MRAGTAPGMSLLGHLVAVPRVRWAAGLVASAGTRGHCPADPPTGITSLWGEARGGVCLEMMGPGPGWGAPAGALRGAVLAGRGRRGKTRDSPLEPPEGTSPAGTWIAGLLTSRTVRG